MSEERAKLYGEKCREYLDRALQSADSGDTAARAAAIGKLRNAHERLITNNPQLVETGQEPFLRSAMEEIIAEYEGSPEAAPVQNQFDVPSVAGDNPARKPVARKPYLAFASGFVVAGLAIAALALSGIADVAFGAKSSRIAKFEQEHQRSIPQLHSAMAFLQAVEADIQRRQRENPEQLTEMAGERLIPLRRLDATLHASQPKDLPRGSNVAVRANGDAYKILFNWPLCRVAAIEMPDLVDSRRSNDGLNCSHFGVWNEEGASF